MTRAVINLLGIVYFNLIQNWSDLLHRMLNFTDGFIHIVGVIDVFTCFIIDRIFYRIWFLESNPSSQTR